MICILRSNRRIQRFTDILWNKIFLTLKNSMQQKTIFIKIKHVETEIGRSVFQRSAKKVFSFIFLSFSIKTELFHVICIEFDFEIVVQQMKLKLICVGFLIGRAAIYFQSKNRRKKERRRNGESVSRKKSIASVHLNFHLLRAIRLCGKCLCMRARARTQSKGSVIIKLLNC